MLDLTTTNCATCIHYYICSKQERFKEIDKAFRKSINDIHIENAGYKNDFKFRGYMLCDHYMEKFLITSMTDYNKYLVTSENYSNVIVHMVYHFDNGFGASVVKRSEAYGGFCELAMLRRYDDGNWDLYDCDDLDIYGLGCLDEYEVAGILETIMNYNERIN